MRAIGHDHDLAVGPKFGYFSDPVDEIWMSHWFTTQDSNPIELNFLAPCLVVRCMFLPGHVPRKRIVIETVATLTVEITNIGDIKLYIVEMHHTGQCLR